MWHENCQKQFFGWIWWKCLHEHTCEIFPHNKLNDQVIRFQPWENGRALILQFSCWLIILRLCQNKRWSTFASSALPETGGLDWVFRSTSSKLRCILLWQNLHSQNGRIETGLFAVVFAHRTKCFWNNLKNLSHFSQNVWNYRLMNTAVVSFNTTVRQMTKISLKKWLKCLSKKKGCLYLFCLQMTNLIGVALFCLLGAH